MLAQKLVDGIVPRSADLVEFKREEDFHRTAKIRGNLRSSKQNENLSEIKNVVPWVSTSKARGDSLENLQHRKILQECHAYALW